MDDMNAAGYRTYWRIALAIVLLTSAALAADKVERIGPPPSDLSDGLKQAVEQKGYRATLDDGWKAEFWFARNLATAKKEVPAALYPELSDGEFVGVVNFPQGMSDYRGQSLAAGVYTLRYQLLPQDGNHLGVAPNPDFLLASPASADSRPEQGYVYRKLIALSAKSTGSNHPAVIALEPAADPDSCEDRARNYRVQRGRSIVCGAGEAGHRRKRRSLAMNAIVECSRQ
jgi:hypothetical protein